MVARLGIFYELGCTGDEKILCVVCLCPYACNGLEDVGMVS